MGYLEDEVKRLQTVLSSVEGRLKALEDRQFGRKAPKTAEEIRMILIGPPGAGKSLTPAKLGIERRQ
jgi:adenylate kinase